MKQQVVHIHGGMAFNSYDDYLRVLKELDISFDHPKDMSRWSKNYYRFLDQERYEVLAPEMPNGNNARYTEWVIWFEKLFPYLRDGLILVGHSLGGTFLAKYLSEKEFPYTISQMHLVAPVYDYQNEWEQLGDFVIEVFPGKLTEKEIPIHIYHSRDDEIVPFFETEKFTKGLGGIELHIFEDRGHFLGTDFLELFSCIQKNEE